jgi:hypothetical protein
VKKPNICSNKYLKRNMNNQLNNYRSIVLERIGELHYQLIDTANNRECGFIKFSPNDTEKEKLRKRDLAIIGLLDKRHII